ncbi:DUF1102 domain-containing protein [Halapricum desulfuricans]|uniref:DUF1102 family n=1 Tax=Halapricum desulfuricans TaxID=2841257 RepID=A0A897NZ62_9EURY|nr:DUF1102 domain-containing protein [Halapricum desulfuricans]QSG16013.1 DUF1102 family [Halapricum desulfuricans]
MKRRNVLAALGTLSAGGALTMGSGAFTSVSAERNVSISVASDANAFLRLAPCSESQNGDYVTGADSGTMTLNLSDSNNNVAGSGLNPDATTVIHNIFEICNQGTQSVGVWLETNPVENDNGDDAVSLYRDSTQNAPVTGADNAICLDTGQCICVGLVARTQGIDPDEFQNLFQPVDEDGEHQMLVHADAEASCGEPAFPPEPSARRLDTGTANWKVTSGPTLSDTRDAQVITDPPSAWDTSNQANWVDPFGTGGLESDPADDEVPYVYELDFEVDAGSRDLVIEEYGADNPVEFFLDESSIGGYSGEEAFDPLRSDIPTQSVNAGTHTLRAEVTNLTGSNGNPTGLLVAARLE